MPVIIPLILVGGVAASMYKLASGPSDAIKENAIPLALIGAGTFLAIRMMQRRGIA